MPGRRLIAIVTQLWLVSLRVVAAATHARTLSNQTAMHATHSLDDVAEQQLSALAAYGLLQAYKYNQTQLPKVLGSPEVGPQQQPILNRTFTEQLIKRSACAAAPSIKRREACRKANGIEQDTGTPSVVFKDRQTSISIARWDSMRDVLYSALDPWTAEDLEPYLYDMDYELPPEGVHADNHLWDPELRQSGMLHCELREDCLTAYLPELYYVGDEYMGGWALDGFDGEGLRIAIGPNIAPGDDPRNYRYTYIPYTQRILFAPAASLFFPYLVSIYAGDVYAAEVDPFLATITRAARAGIVIDYYYVNNYYNSYSFFSIGVASSAVFAAAARARGVIGAGVKLRNFNTVLASLSRNDYDDRNRIGIINSLSFVGTSGGGYLFSIPLQRNAFIGQNPLTSIPYYAYDYTGAANPFPLQPAG